MPIVQFGDIGVRGSQFVAGITGSNSSAFVVESSSNLIDWMPVSTNVAGGAPVLFQEAIPAGVLQGFYRARIP
jgi:hypothetical protein